MTHGSRTPPSQVDPLPPLHVHTQIARVQIRRHCRSAGPNPCHAYRKGALLPPSSGFAFRVPMPVPGSIQAPLSDVKIT